MASWVRLYTYGEVPINLVRGPGGDPRAAGPYAAGLPGVNVAVHARAAIGVAAAEAVLAGHVSDQTRSSHPTITLDKGDRTDWYINMHAHPRSGAFSASDNEYAAALSIEYGHGSYVDSLGRFQHATQGVHALSAAMAAMGGGF